VAPRDWGWFGLLAKAAVWSLAVYIVYSMLGTEVKRSATRANIYSLTNAYERGKHPMLEQLVVTREWMSSNSDYEYRKLNVTVDSASGKPIRILVMPAEGGVTARVEGKVFDHELGKLSGTDVATWYTAAGAPAKEGSDRELAERLAMCIQMLIDHPEWSGISGKLGVSFGASQTSTSTRGIQNHLPLQILQAASAGAWLTGLGLILLWRRKPPLNA
jgi:hypothetical protein